MVQKVHEIGLAVATKRTEPNKALQPTAYSVRSCVAPAFGSG
jgi:hypothetical protein